MKPKLLIVEDDEAVRAQWQWALAEDYDVLLAADQVAAMEAFRTERPDVSLVDLGLPPHADDPTEGLAVVNRIRGLDDRAKVIVVSGLADQAEAMRAIGGWGCDFLCKPVPLGALKLLLQRCHQAPPAAQGLPPSSADHPPSGCEGLYGRSPQMQELFTTIRKVAPSDAPVLLVGESGSGKELTARAIHRLSGRQQGPFVAVECGAIPPEQLEVELFGIEDDGTTRRSARRACRIGMASGGTLFLDGITELPLRLQVRLLRLLRENRLERAHGHESARVDTRVIAATSVDPAAALAAGQFRSDLYYFLAVVVLRIPPLRERREDIRGLADVFLARFSELYQKPAVRLGPAAARGLERHPWPGNVRELENCLKRAVIMAEQATLELNDLDLPVPLPPPISTGLREARHETEREMLLRALRRHRGRIAPAAAELGISRPTFYALMRRLGVRRPGGTPSGWSGHWDGNGI